MGAPFPHYESFDDLGCLYNGVWLEGNQHIHIAFRAKIVPKYRTEQGQSLDSIALAEFIQFLLGNLDFHTGRFLYSHFL
jgi:hypothetical protein